MFMYEGERKQFDKRKYGEAEATARAHFMLPVVKSDSVTFCFEKDATVARLSFRNHGAGRDFTCQGFRMDHRTV